MIHIEKDKLSFFLNWNNSLIIKAISFLNTIIVLIAVAKWRERVSKKLSWGVYTSPKIFLKISKCPLDETGRNSVRPWISPRKNASKTFIYFDFTKIE